MDTSGTKTRYLLGLGSNRYRSGPPRLTIVHAISALRDEGIEIERCSTIRTTAPLGPGRRNYANAAVLIRTDRNPPALLALSKAIEGRFGRRSGRRWGDRIIDIDILLWSGGCWAGDRLTVPHPSLAMRPFVLAPLVEIAPDWRHPVNGHSMRQLHHRLQRNMPVDRTPNRP